jgi:hypothetical protein
MGREIELGEDGGCKKYLWSQSYGFVIYNYSVKVD